MVTMTDLFDSLSGSDHLHIIDNNVDFPSGCSAKRQSNSLSQDYASSPGQSRFTKLSMVWYQTTFHG